MAFEKERFAENVSCEFHHALLHYLLSRVFIIERKGAWVYKEL
jgi:hypothetical protein